MSAPRLGVWYDHGDGATGIVARVYAHDGITWVDLVDPYDNLTRCSCPAHQLVGAPMGGVEVARRLRHLQEQVTVAQSRAAAHLAIAAREQERAIFATRIATWVEATVSPTQDRCPPAEEV